MKLFVFINTILVLCGTLTSAYRIDTFTLPDPFKLPVFLQGYSRLDKSLDTSSSGKILVGNSPSSYTTFKLTNGALTSQSTGKRYYLKNQTGIEYPSYIFAIGQPQSNDLGIFGATPNHSLWGRSLLPDIQVPEPGAGNLWVACLTDGERYTIGWDANIATPPPAGCVNYVTYNPGVILNIGSI